MNEPTNSTNLPGSQKPAPSPETDRLIKQFVEDRDSLSPEELDQLIEILRGEPRLAIEVRTQLLVDDLLAQKLALDRRNFLAQVGQRIGDFEQGEEEILSQVSELRALAEAELDEQKVKKGNPWTMVAMIALAASLAAIAFLAPQYWPVAPRAVAKITEVRGEVLVRKGGSQVPAQIGDTLYTGTPVEVPSGGLVLLEYVDKTTVEFGSGSQFELIADRKSQAKLVRVQQGEVLARVMPQRNLGPMEFRTPQARAVVLGTEFRLLVSPLTTRLDVTHGKVDFVQNSSGTKSLVAANQSAVADAQGLVLRDLEWPDVAQNLLFKLHGPENPDGPGKLTLVLNPESGALRETELAARGPARFIEGVNVYSLNGGSFVSAEAGVDLVADIQKQGAFTLDAIVMPDTLLRTKESRVISLGDDGKQANFQLVQNASQLIFRLRTDSNQTYELKLGQVRADHAVHVTVAFDGRSLHGYLNGKSVGQVTGIQGGLGTWSSGAFCLGADQNGQNVWRGTICDLAIADHALPAFDVTQSAGQYQALYARRDVGLSWDNLMAENLDPAQLAGTGNWQLNDDGWENGATADAWFALGPGGMKNYDLLVDVNLVAGNGPVEIALPVADRPVKVVLSTSGSEQKTSVQDMGGGPMSGSVSISNDRSLPEGRTARLEVQVRSHRDGASLNVSFDGEPLVDWKGSLTELPEAKSPLTQAGSKPVLVAAGNKVRIEALKVRNLNRTPSSAIGQ